MKKNLNIIFSVMLLSGIALYWLVMCLTSGQNMEAYYLNDFADTSMDYFNMLANIKYGDPYIFHSNYPAMCFFILKVLFKIIPDGYVGLDGYGLRNCMPAQLGYICLMLSILIIIWEVIKVQFKGRHLEGYLAASAFMLSGPMIFTIERGNLILVSFAFLLIFTACYDSPKKCIRYLGYVALAISASLKIYPALFGILILQKKRYKEAGMTMILGTLFFVLPFFIFNGIQSIKDMIGGIFLSSSLQGNYGMGYNFSFVNLIKILAALCGIVIENIPGIVKVIPIVVCSLIYVLNKENWKKIFAISLFCIWMPEFSYTYTLIYFIAAVIVYFKEENFVKNNFSYLYRILFLIIFLPLALPSISNMDIEDAKLPITLPTIIINFAIVSMSVFMIIEGITYRKKKGEL